jgi:hypothetical protein
MPYVIIGVLILGVVALAVAPIFSAIRIAVSEGDD